MRGVHARHPQIYPFSFLLVSPRRAAPRRVSWCFVPSSSLFLHTLNFKLSLQPLLSTKTSPWSRFFLRYHSLRFAKRKSTKDPPRIRLKPVEGSTRSPTPLPRIPLNGLSLASPFRNRSMKLVSSPRLDFSVGLLRFPFLAFVLLYLALLRLALLRLSFPAFFFPIVGLSPSLLFPI